MGAWVQDKLIAAGKFMATWLWYFTGLFLCLATVGLACIGVHYIFIHFSYLAVVGYVVAVFSFLMAAKWI